MDTLTRSSRISYACAFGATAFLIYKVLLEYQLAVDYDGPVSLKSKCLRKKSIIATYTHLPLDNQFKNNKLIRELKISRLKHEVTR